jgi:hypothetical protein
VTIQDVDSETFYAVGKGLFKKAGKLYDAFNVNVNILGGTGSMAGTDDAGKAWATSYDERVKEVLGAVNDLTKALENYGGVVIQAGYNHAVAEHNATPGNQGPAPAMPPEPASTAGVLSAPPSAGGPGRGLVDAVGLMQQVGAPVPDGDTDKVSKAADAWDRLVTVYQTKTIAKGLEVDARTFRDTHSPEVEYIVRDLEELRDAMTSVTDGCAELSQSCKDYKSALDDLRKQLEGILEDLAIELAVTAAIGIAASFVSFGAGAVAGTAKAAQSITKFARIISEAVGAWKISKNIASGVKTARDIAGLRAKLQRIINMGRKGKPKGPPPPPSGVPPGWVARPADNGTGTVYQQPGALGNSNSIRIMEPGADARYPNGYVRFTNEHNQPINLDGKPGTRAETHIPRNPDGSFPIPKGWP